MLLYTDIVSKVLNREVLPCFKNILKAALVKNYGNNWYTAFAQNILCSYADYPHLTKMIEEENRDPMDCLDLTAFFFLLNPYQKENGQIQHFTGALPLFAEHAQLLDWQTRRLDRIRLIRNGVAHDKCDPDFVADEANLKTGAQESKWIAELEEILRFFDPSISLAAYKGQLSQEVERTLTEQPAQHVPAPHITEAVNIRKEISRIIRLDYCEAPLHEPMDGPAPWTLSSNDLEKLPWPSQAFSQAEAQKQAQSQPNTPAGGSVADKITAEAADLLKKQLDQKVNKFLGWMNNRK